MSDIAYKIYNKYINESTSSPYIKSGFIKLYTFSNITDITAAMIDEVLYGRDNKSSLYFTPMGCIYITGLITKTFINPIVQSLPKPKDGQSDDRVFDTAWSPVDFKKYIRLVSLGSYPKYVVSAIGALGTNDNGDIIYGSGYVLRREGPYPRPPGDTGEWDLLVMPLDRLYKHDQFLVLPINGDPARLTKYCKQIDYQAPVCYCDNNTDECKYAVCHGKNNYEEIKKSVEGSKDPKALKVLNQFTNQCACNPICQQWKGLYLLNNKPTCSDSSTNVFCSVNLTSSDGSQLNLGDLGIDMACGAENAGLDPFSDENQKMLDEQDKKMRLFFAKILISCGIGIAIVVTVGIYLLFKYKKK